MSTMKSMPKFRVGDGVMRARNLKGKELPSHERRAAVVTAIYKAHAATHEGWAGRWIVYASTPLDRGFGLYCQPEDHFERLVAS